MREALSSLRDVYLLWYPQTTATFEQRLEVLDAMRQQYPSVSWNLLVEIVPTGHGVAAGTSKPRWKLWATEPKESLTYAELARQVGVIVDRLIADVAEDPKRWEDLVGLVDKLPAADFVRVLGVLTQASFSEAPSDQLVSLWGTLRKLIAHHWEFPDAEWALPDEKVGQLFEIYENLTPSDPLQRFRWLFSPNPDVPVRGVGSSFPARDAVATAQRVSAVRELAEGGDVGRVFELVELVESPWHVGHALAQAETAIPSTDFLRESLDVSNPRRLDAAQGFLQGIVSRHGISGIEDLLHSDVRWTPVERAQMFIALPFNIATWDQLKDEAPEVRENYWSGVWVTGKGKLSSSVVRRAATELLDHSQVTKAVDFLGLYRAEFQPDLAVRALQQLAASPPSDPRIWEHLGHDILSLMGGLHEAGVTNEQELASLEWFYLPIMSRVQHGYRPPTLDRALADNPSLFVDVLKTIYRAKDQVERTEPTEEEKWRAQHGFELLYQWSTLPGSLEGDVDKEKLQRWITGVRELARAAGREEVADVHVGQILAFSPDGRDGLWPHEAVRAMLEELANETIERGFETQVYNNRGITTRAVGEGGEQERELARRFSALSRQLISKWPRTGSVLQRIALGYEADARRQDQEAEIDRSRWE